MIDHEKERNRLKKKFEEILETLQESSSIQILHSVGFIYEETYKELMDMRGELKGNYAQLGQRELYAMLIFNGTMKTFIDMAEDFSEEEDRKFVDKVCDKIFEKCKEVLASEVITEDEFKSMASKIPHSKSSKSEKVDFAKELLKSDVILKGLIQKAKENNISDKTIKVLEDTLVIAERIKKFELKRKEQGDGFDIKENIEEMDFISQKVDILMKDIKNSEINRDLRRMENM